MSKRRGEDRSISQRVANRGRERRLSRDDAFTAYAMDRLLCRLGKSSHASEFILKGGVLVAQLIRAPHRFTRDIDVLRRQGPPDPDEIRERFRAIVSVPLEDGVTFDPAGVRAVVAEHDEDGYDGVKVLVRARVAGHELDLQIDIGFGDAVDPLPSRVQLDPFLDGDEAARVVAYEPGPVIAEKVEAILSKFPAIQHRLKDLLDVVALSDALSFDGPGLVASVRATLERRGTPPDVRVLDDMHSELRGRRWLTDWATMLREKAVAAPPDLAEAVARFEAFVRPLLEAVAGGPTPDSWEPGAGWR